jgi:hypothetical protein
MMPAARFMLGFLVAAALFGYSQIAQAQCIAGLPCVVGKTPNLPENADDGPNQSGAPNATKTDSNACDADFMNQIYARAFLEAERENVMNKDVLRKPDSVLEYTCFDQLVSVAAWNADKVFSGKNWTATLSNPGAISKETLTSVTPGVPANITVAVNMGALHLDNSLEGLVMTSLGSYIASNFSHRFLGGAADTDGSIIAEIGPNDYNCTFMDQVHFWARCANFDTHNPFLTFETLANIDPRALPPHASECSGTGITSGIMDVAENKDLQYVNFDAVDPFLGKLLAPNEENQVETCAPPIPTGVLVTKNRYVVTDEAGNVDVESSETYVDKICPNPSCYFEPPNTCTQ